jgi:hypothetical protein
VPKVVGSIEDENMLHGCVEPATFATDILYDGKKTLVYIAPTITSLPRNNPALLDKMSYLRAKVVSSMSTAGYWHTSLRGVAFRAFLRGSYNRETIWTGDVIGWRLSVSSIPAYYSQTDRAIGVRALIIMGGYNDADQISKYNPDMYSPGYKVVCESNTETYDSVFRVGISFRDDIINANRGHRFPKANVSGAFINFGLGPAPRPSRDIMADRAVLNITRQLRGLQQDDYW